MPKPSGGLRSRRSALVLAPEAPYPVVGGGPLRTASVIEYLRKHYHVHVITFREPGAPDPGPEFPPGVVVDVIDLPFHAKTSLARALRNFDRLRRRVPPLVDRFAGFGNEIECRLGTWTFDVGVIEHFWCAPYASVLRSRCNRLLLDLHNVESVLLARSAASAGGTQAFALRRFARHCEQLEAEWLPAFDTVLVASAADRDHAGVDGAVVYPNTIPPIPQPQAMKREEIVFSGNLEYHPNSTGVRWFYRSVWPHVSAAYPQLMWRIVGRNERSIRALTAGDARVCVTGPVRDAIQALAPATAAVVPIICGSGTRVKIIEAWAAGLPVISTTLGAEGLPCRPGEHLLIADSPVAFVEAIGNVFGSPKLQTRLGTNGRRLYEEKLTWDSAWRVLADIGL